MTLRWNFDKYNELCKACDSVLLGEGSNLITISIPWLHVVRPHPVFLSQYDNVFGHSDKDHNYSKYIRHTLRQFIACNSFFLNPLASHPSWWTSYELTGSADILFVSHLINKCHIGLPNDFYFGDLPKRLKMHGITSSFALINHTSSSSLSDSDWRHGESTPRFFLSKYLPFLEELEIRCQLVKESRRLINAIPRAPYSHIRVWQEAARQSLSSGSISNLRIAHQVQHLVDIIRPRFVVTTFEGHGWERLVFASARLVNPDILCFGYQHAALFPLQHSISRDLGSRYDPDILLSTGPTAAAKLRSQMSDHIKPITVVGSVRSISGIVGPVPLKTDCILILPEGLIDECLLMFRFALKAAFLFPKIEFIWRLHPLISRLQLLRLEPMFSKLPSNIRWPILPLDNDFALARWSLYRGSTAIFQAAAYGCLPIYLHLNDDLTVDPLSDIKMYRPIVSTVESLCEIFYSKVGSQATDKIQAYCLDYFTSLNVNSLLRAMKTGNSC